MKTINRSKIEWCTHVWPVVVGCDRGCTVETAGFNCYGAEAIKRVADIYATGEIEYLKDDKKTKGIWRRIVDYRPTFLNYVFAKKLPKKPASIFLCVFTDPAHWKPEWWQRIKKRIEENPQHAFILLTKNPTCYYAIRESLPHNVAVGVTALTEKQITKAQDVFGIFTNHTTVLSIEPLQQEIDPSCIDPSVIDLVIVGGLSGPGVKPKREWVDGFRYGRWRWMGQGDGILYFEKNNLQKIVNRELIQELPWPIESKP